MFLWVGTFLGDEFVNIEKSWNSMYEKANSGDDDVRAESDWGGSGGGDDDEKDHFPPAAEGGVARVWALRGFPR